MRSLIRGAIFGFAIVMAAPAIGILMAQLGLIHPPELPRTAPQPVGATDASPIPGAELVESWAVLEDRSPLLELGRAVVEAGDGFFSTDTAAWNYHVLRSDGGTPGPTRTVMVTEKLSPCIGQPGCDRPKYPLTLWVTVERRETGIASGSIAAGRAGTHRMERGWTFTARLEEGQWRVVLQPS